MGFTIVEGSPRSLWIPVDGNAGSPDTLYIGSIVECAGDGLLPIGEAAGPVDSAGLAVPFGVVIGTNNRSPLSDSTQQAEYIVGADTQALQLAREKAIHEGPTPKNDPAAMVEIGLITPSTILRGPLFNSSYGTVPTEQTITTRQTDGMITAEVWSTSDAAQLADNSTIYMRSGLNRGMYRVGINTSATGPSVDIAFPYDNTTSDTGVQVAVRPYGPSKVQFDTESTFVNIGTTVSTTKYYVVDVIEIHLDIVGDEHILFKFNADHFCSARA